MKIKVTRKPPCPSLCTLSGRPGKPSAKISFCPAFEPFILYFIMYELRVLSTIRKLSSSLNKTPFANPIFFTNTSFFFVAALYRISL